MTWFERWRGLRGWRADLAAALLGALAATALPPVHLIPALFIAVPGLLALIDGTRSAAGGFRRGFWFGLGHHVVGLYWITEAILIESTRYWWLVPFAVPALAAVLALFIGAACAAARLASPGWPRALTLAGAWTLADLARQFVATGFPWNPWGSVWAIPGVAGDIMIQPAAWIGTPGLTLLTVLLAAAPAFGTRALAGAAAVLLLWAGLGTARLAEPAPPAPGYDVVLVQGNVPQNEKFDRNALVAAFDRQLQLTRDGVAKAGGVPSIVVWPEASTLPYLLQYRPDKRQAIMQAARPALAALVGGLTTEQAPTPESWLAHPPSNSLIALTGPDADIAAIYSKWHLVPFGEYAPSWVPLSIKLVPGQFSFGTGPRTLRIAGLPPVGPLICYEVVFPTQVIDERSRPAWIVNITNDAWFGNSAGPRQHLAAARMRAVEEGLPLLRAANTGITVGFDSRGHELGRLPMNVPGVLTIPLPGPRPATSFSRWGLAIPGLLSLLCAGFGLRRRLSPSNY